MINMMSVHKKMETRETFRILDIHLLVKKFLTLYVVLLPFQNLPAFFLETERAKQDPLVRALSYSDEITTLILLVVLLTFVAMKPQSFKIRKAGITRPLIVFVVAGLFSILLNGVYVVQGALGVYDFVKNIIIIYLFASLRWSEEEILTLIEYLKMVVLVLAVAGIVGEGLALYGIDPWGLVVFEEHTKRLGLYRVLSLTGPGNMNYLGMYAVLCLFLIGSSGNFVEEGA